MRRARPLIASAIAALVCIVVILETRPMPTQDALLAMRAGANAPKDRAPSAQAGQLKGHAVSPAEQAVAALKDTHLFWGDALQLDDDDGTKPPMKWRDYDHNLQEMADDALALCNEVQGQETGGEEAVEGEGQGTKRRCVHRVVSAYDTRFTHTPAGINEWAQPLRDKGGNDGPDGEKHGALHNYALSLQKIIDQFKPITSWHGQKIYDQGVILRIPTYDRSRYRGFRGASNEVNLNWETSAGNRKFGEYTDSDADLSGDEAYDQLALDAEKMIWGKKPGFEAAHEPQSHLDERRNKAKPLTTLVKHNIGKYTVWEHKVELPGKHPAARPNLKPQTHVQDPLMIAALTRGGGGRGGGGRRVISRLYGPHAQQVPAEQAPTARMRSKKERAKNVRMEGLWEVTPTLNIGGNIGPSYAPVATETQTFYTPLSLYPPAYYTPLSLSAPAIMPANALGALPPLPTQPCGSNIEVPSCGDGIVAAGASARAQQPYAGYAQWIHPQPLQYALPPPPPVYMNKVTSAVTSTAKPPPGIYISIYMHI
jgi:hypothetical protein